MIISVRPDIRQARADPGRFFFFFGGGRVGFAGGLSPRSAGGGNILNYRTLSGDVLLRQKCIYCNCVAEYWCLIAKTVELPSASQMYDAA